MGYYLELGRPHADVPLNFSEMLRVLSTEQWLDMEHTDESTELYITNGRGWVLHSPTERLQPPWISIRYSWGTGPEIRASFLAWLDFADVIGAHLIECDRDGAPRMTQKTVPDAVAFYVAARERMSKGLGFSTGTESDEGDSEDPLPPFSTLIERELAPGERQLSIRILGLSVRSEASLARAGVLTIGQVLDLDERAFLRHRNLGRKSLKEVRDRLREYGR